MSFISVTRPGATRTLRMRIEAIAFLDDAADAGCAIRLIGGDSVVVTETPAEVEALCEPTIVALQVGDRRIEYSPGVPASELPAADAATMGGAPAPSRKVRR